MPAASSPGRRARSRLRVQLGVKLTTLTSTQNAMLVDISLNGARIALTRPIEEGLDVVLEWGPFEAFGKVLWRHEDTCGVRFYDPISPEALIATRDIDDNRLLPGDRELTREAAADWAQGTRRL